MNIAFQLINYISALALTLNLNSLPSCAQVIPDNTLNNNSVIKTINKNLQEIEGGEREGVNLFHSFLEFSIGEDKAIYFANPQGIENILSRITGDNPSQIFGKLGVLGEANLFLINPNGIIFGEHSFLDIKGSFLATTGNGISLRDSSYFGIKDRDRDQLLNVTPGTIFFEQLNQGKIVNRGNLSAGRDLALIGNDLDLQGQIIAGKNLTLQAANAIAISDTLTSPLIIYAAENLSIEGKNLVNIFTLNFLTSGLYAGKDLFLRSNFPIGGDGRFWSGRNFRVEKLDRSLGGLNSPKDPIIVANGDVFLDFYQGASLHILAGGSVRVNFIVINDRARLGEAIDTNLAPNLATITLGDGSTLIINGSTYPTLDIRAGIDWTQLGGNPGTLRIGSLPFFTTSEVPSHADIVVSNVFIDAPDGLVLLSNNFQENPLLKGSITVSGIYTGNNIGNSGAVVIDSKNNINILFDEFNPSGYIDTTSLIGDGGNVKLIANEGIFLNRSAIATTSQLGKSGDIDILADVVSLFNDSEDFANRSSVSGNNVRINSNNLLLEDNASLNTTTLNERDAGDIKIDTNHLTIKEGSLISSGSLGEGNAGNLVIKASESIVIDSANELFSGISNIGSENSKNNAGNLTIETKTLALDRNGLISSGTLGEGNAGNLTIKTESLILQNNSLIDASSFGNGKGGDILIKADREIIIDGFGSGIFSLSNSENKEGIGTLKIETDNLILNNFAVISTTVLGNRNASILNIEANNLILENGSLISGTTFGESKGGDIFIVARDRIFISGESSIISQANQVSNGNSGDINLFTKNLTLRNFSSISNATFNQQNGGNIAIEAENILLDNDGIITSRATEGGNSGNITIKSDRELNANFGEVSTNSARSSGGKIEIVADNIILRGDTNIATNVDIGAGNGGDINITADSILAFDDSDILAFARDGKGGSINLNTPIFFGNSFAPTTKEVSSLDRNGLVDLNASGRISGTILIPDLNFIRNSLSQLSEYIIDTDNIIANSCIVSNPQQIGTFLIIGPGGKTPTPGDLGISNYSIGDVQTEDVWQTGDPIIEPQDVYRLSDGKLILSRECDR
jgi:filamentous hemagglutinin family protein